MKTKKPRGAGNTFRGPLWSQTPNPIKGSVVMSTDKFAVLLRAVNVFMANALKNLIPMLCPVIRCGELYSREQAQTRLGIGDRTLKAWEQAGLHVWNPPGTNKFYYRGDALIEFVGRFPRLDDKG